MAGPVYYSDLYRDHPEKLPDYYTGKLFIYEWTRNWIRVVSMDGNDNYTGMEPFMASSEFVRPVDMQFGPDGRLYLLEYGTAWNTPNPDSRLVRIDYNPGNRAPVARIDVSQRYGAAPLTVEFSAEHSKDYDGDVLDYEWNFGASSAGSSEIRPAFTYEQPGVYTAELTVTDPHGAGSTTDVDIRVGNAPPRVSVILEGNNTFYFDGQERSYTVQVRDKEDGTLESGSISTDEVIVEFRYVNGGLDEMEDGEKYTPAAFSILGGKRLIEVNDCRACHMLSRDLTGPSFTAISNRYKENSEAIGILAKKVITGGSGNWGERAMPAHPELSQSEAEAIIRYILLVGQKDRKHDSLPREGTLVTQRREESTEEGGGYVLSAAYTDRGANGIAPLSAGEVIVLRDPQLSVFEADNMQIAAEYTSPEDSLTYALLNDGSWLRFNDIDLTGIDRLEFSLMLTGKSGHIELRSGSAGGTLLAAADVPVGRGAYKAKADLPDIRGMHDLFIVINSKEYAGQTLFLMDFIRFYNSK